LRGAKKRKKEKKKKRKAVFYEKQPYALAKARTFLLRFTQFRGCFFSNDD